MSKTIQKIILKRKLHELKNETDIQKQLTYNPEKRSSKYLQHKQVTTTPMNNNNNPISFTKQTPTVKYSKISSETPGSSRNNYVRKTNNPQRFRINAVNESDSNLNSGIRFNIVNNLSNNAYDGEPLNEIHVHQNKINTITISSENKEKNVNINANINTNININTNSNLVDINDLIGEKVPLTYDILDMTIGNFEKSKTSSKQMGIIKSYAANTHQGLVRNYNEDRVSIIINMHQPQGTNKKYWPKVSFFGIYDGHGGNKCAEFLRDSLHKFICADENFPENVPAAIKNGFALVEQKFMNMYAIPNNANNENITQEMIKDKSGSCAVIALLVDTKIYFANVGDSRALMSLKNGAKFLQVTVDHKPNEANERLRIIQNGGKVYQSQTMLGNNPGNSGLNGKILIGPFRVLPGRLSVSRTIGDVEAKNVHLRGNPNVIVPYPDIFIYDVKNDDLDFFILGCDGIYDQVSNEEILENTWKILNNTFEPADDMDSKNNDNNNQNLTIHEKSGKIVDFILKASMFRKSFDNVTSLIVMFKDLEMNKEISPRIKIDKITKIQANIVNKTNDSNINSESGGNSKSHYLGSNKVNIHKASLSSSIQKINPIYKCNSSSNKVYKNMNPNSMNSFKYEKKITSHDKSGQNISYNQTMKPENTFNMGNKYKNLNLLTDIKNSVGCYSNKQTYKPGNSNMAYSQVNDKVQNSIRYKRIPASTLSNKSGESNQLHSEQNSINKSINFPMRKRLRNFNNQNLNSHHNLIGNNCSGNNSNANKGIEVKKANDSSSQIGSVRTISARKKQMNMLNFTEVHNKGNVVGMGYVALKDTKKNKIHNLNYSHTQGNNNMCLNTEYANQKNSSHYLKYAE